MWEPFSVPCVAQPLPLAGKATPMAKAQQRDEWSNQPDPNPPSDANPVGSDQSEINPGTKPNAAQPAPPHGNPDAVEHAMIEGAGADKKAGGRDESQVAAPTVSLYPSSQPQGESDAEVGEHRIIDKVNMGNFSSVPKDMQQQIYYPFQDMEFGQGMFIPVEKGGTIDKLMSKIHKQVDQFRKQNSEVERDEDGDDVMEDVAINKKQRNDDGTVKLDGDVPRLGIKSCFRPKLLGPNFAVKAVVKGDKLSESEEADADGALVIRLG